MQRGGAEGQELPQLRAASPCGDQLRLAVQAWRRTASPAQGGGAAADLAGCHRQGDLLGDERERVRVWLVPIAGCQHVGGRAAGDHARVSLLADELRHGLRLTGTDSAGDGQDGQLVVPVVRAGVQRAELAGAPPALASALVDALARPLF